MAKVAERDDKLGNLLKMEQGKEWGYCRKTATVTLTPTSDIGDVLYDVAGDLTLVNVANTASAEAIIVDPNIIALRPASGTADVEVAVLFRGAAVVADSALNYNADINTPAEIAALHDALEALGIAVRKQA